ncbi:monofunctional C1-tetrahydrofolate synthase, mitochondrial isoform X10 [Gopherus evgoodei]|uniref:monofunctional C1-tetrahydrofolate synthase, mitochondrial isoform X10 n=1 Tax=Gopherus evgoodei TaxID=1825980 RepID=UPI0011CF002A|nr:monofunctional C1-tetrahydrofolate synthase, mitochondrial isoform X10 [Gopherus evgoodei]
MRFSALCRLSRGAAAPLAGRRGIAPRRGTASAWGRWEKHQAGGARGSAAGKIIQSSKKVLASLQKGHPTFKPTLAIVQVSDEDLVQEINQNFAKEIGLHVIHICLPQGSSEDEIVGEILRLNEDPTVHGVALHLSENAFSSKILNAVKPEKDVDGVSDVNLGRLVRGDTYNCLVSPTASAVMELLEKLAVKTVDGKKVLLVETCGPLEASLQCLLQRKGAMTMSCQWKTQQLQSKLHQADVVVVGSTKPKEIPVSWIRPGTTIVNCYPDFLSGEHGYGQDVKYSNQSAIDAVGPLTIAMRMQQLSWVRRGLSHLCHINLGGATFKEGRLQGPKKTW